MEKSKFHLFLQLLWNTQVDISLLKEMRIDLKDQIFNERRHQGSKFTFSYFTARNFLQLSNTTEPVVCGAIKPYLFFVIIT